jgi:6-pyruvoyltetrahydropterin/6-carboxytetrahydropterin synthase
MNLHLPPIVAIARRVYFSVGRQAPLDKWPPRLRLPHGFDCILTVYYRGAVPLQNGMVANISDIKPALAKAVAPLDCAMLTGYDGILTAPPSVENIVKFLWKRLPSHLDGGHLDRLILEVSPHLWVEKTSEVMRITRKYEFAAAHRLCSPDLTNEENLALYGKCANLAGHGHNYGLEVTVEGTPNEAGFIIAPHTLDAIVEAEVFTRFDHKHLNEDCPEFEDLIPTSENFARVIFAVLQEKLNADGHRLAKIGLHETQKNYFEVEAEGENA